MSKSLQYYYKLTGDYQYDYVHPQFLKDITYQLNSISLRTTSFYSFYSFSAQIIDNDIYIIPIFDRQVYLYKYRTNQFIDLTQQFYMNFGYRTWYMRLFPIPQHKIFAGTYYYGVIKLNTNGTLSHIFGILPPTGGTEMSYTKIIHFDEQKMIILGFIRYISSSGEATIPTLYFIYVSNNHYIIQYENPKLPFTCPHCNASYNLDLFIPEDPYRDFYATPLLDNDRILHYVIYDNKRCKYCNQLYNATYYGYLYLNGTFQLLESYIFPVKLPVYSEKEQRYISFHEEEKRYMMMPQYFINGKYFYTEQHFIYNPSLVYSSVIFRTQNKIITNFIYQNLQYSPSGLYLLQHQYGAELIFRDTQYLYWRIRLEKNAYIPFLGITLNTSSWVYFITQNDTLIDMFVEPVQTTTTYNTKRFGNLNFPIPVFPIPVIMYDDNTKFYVSKRNPIFTSNVDGVYELDNKLYPTYINCAIPTIINPCILKVYDETTKNFQYYLIDVTYTYPNLRINMYNLKHDSLFFTLENADIFNPYNSDTPPEYFTTIIDNMHHKT